MLLESRVATESKVQKASKTGIEFLPQKYSENQTRNAINERPVLPVLSSLLHCGSGMCPHPVHMWVRDGNYGFESLLLGRKLKLSNYAAKTTILVQ